MAGPGDRLKAIERDFGVKLPARYVSFIVQREYERYVGQLRGLPCFGDTLLDLGFAHPCLRSLEELSQHSLAGEIADGQLDWAEAYPALVPLATVDYAGVRRPQGAKHVDASTFTRAFLVLDTSEPACPVLLYSELHTFPLAASLDELLGRLPAREAARSSPARPPSTTKKRRPTIAEGKIRQARASGATSLSLEGLELKALPDELWAYVELKELALSSNPLRFLPPEIGRLASLERLDLAGTRIAELPKEVGGMVQLRDLNLDNSLCRKLPPLKELTALRSLHYRENRAVRLPKPIFELAQLEELDASFNLLEEVPQEISALRRLAQLDLSNNCLRGLSRGVVELGQLQSLALSGNSLHAFPDVVLELVWLRRLAVAGHDFGAVPEGLGRLAALEELDLSSCALADLPAELSRLEQLRTLKLSSNRLTGIPEPVWRLPSLQELFVDGNQIRCFTSAEIERLRGLKTVRLTPNPFFRSLEAEPLAPGAGIGELLDWMQQRSLGASGRRLG